MTFAASQVGSAQFSRELARTSGSSVVGFFPSMIPGGSSPRDPRSAILLAAAEDKNGEGVKFRVILHVDRVEESDT